MSSSVGTGHPHPHHRHHHHHNHHDQQSYPGVSSSSRPTSAVPSAAYSADALAPSRSPEVTTGTAVTHGRPSLNTKSRTSTAGPEAGGVSSTSAFSSANTPVSTFTKNSRVETKEILFAGNFYFHTEHRLPNQPQAVTRSVTHKTRLFGQSHWVNAVGLVSVVPALCSFACLRLASAVGGFWRWRAFGFS